MQQSNRVNHLAALDWLARGVDMTSLTPFSIEQVKTRIDGPRLIAIQDDKTTYEVSIGGETYTLPRVVSASESHGIRNDDKDYNSGSAALSAFQSDPSSLAVNTDVSSYPLKKSLPTEYQFSFFTFGADVYTASLRNYLDFIDNDFLRKKIAKLPQPFSPGDNSAVAAYKAFFAELGTHVINSTTFGGRCSISTWASNEYHDVNSNWKKDVTAHLRGMNDRGNFDSNALDEPQYQVFLTIAQTLCTITGGEEAAADSISQGNFDFDVLVKWSSTIPSLPALTSIGVLPLWSLLRDSEDGKVRDAADNIEAAFKAIVEENEKKQHGVVTLVILKSESGVAEFGLSTPGSIVGVGGPLPTYDPTTQKVIGLSETKVRVGQSGEAQKERLAAFYIVNDGTPIDFTLGRDMGNACVLINGKCYKNNDKGLVRYYKVPVIPDNVSPQN
ncbi:hypothetical protein AAF712_000385 [Marasmius tenuissimus]|uniref:MACPF domain-containing protein n=1 Tax=Marasmius tenuissimus TaxID=585030 RepID=A0ABR3AGX1_9AGAR